ncbi:histidinol-phosphate transaminase [Brevibacterium litoralis]|uniref:histidinol-phosphate transaminase n=1 Tax=Brevibacterium litoralis TaxID=3138935 RepID=UPI0032EB2BF8
MTTDFRFRPSLATTPAYVPGKPPQAPEGVTSHKLSSNELHLEPLPGVVQAVAEAATNPATYPDPAAKALTAELAAHLDVDPARVILTAGGSEGLSAMALATLEAGREVVFPWPSFESYPQLAARQDARAIRVPLTAEARHDLPAMAAALTDATGLVLLCSPNNPTGPALRTDEFREFMAQVPTDVLVVLDEAYLEFVTDPDAVDGLAEMATYPNLVLVRTFSKAHGLAGLRVGYTVADPRVIAELRKTVAVFSVPAVSQAAALESVRRWSEVEVRAKQVADTRDRLAAGLRAQGWQVPDAQANFVWVPLDDEAAARLEAEFLAVGLSVRKLPGGIRISIGADEAMDRVLQVTAAFRAESQGASGADDAA